MSAEAIARCGVRIGHPPLGVVADAGAMAHPRHTDSKSAERPRLVVRPAPLDLYDYAAPPSRTVHFPRHTPDPIAVTDNWPATVPVSAAEVAIIEAYFGDVLDDLFGPLP